MAKVTEYPRITKMKDNDILLVDGPDGTRTILKSNAAKELGGEIIAVSKNGSKDKVTLNLTDSPIDLATEKDLDGVADALLPIGTASGTPAVVTDAKIGTEFKELKAGIELVQAGTGDPSPDNVRPITGWTAARVTRYGKNLLPYVTKALNGTNVMLGQTQSYTQAWETHLAPGDYVLSAVTSKNCYLHYRNADGTVTGDSSAAMNPVLQFTVTEEDDFAFWASNGGGFIQNNVISFQLEHGSVATEYEPYSGETFDITFPSEAGTVYGGTLDLTAGTLTVTWQMVMASSLNWGYVNDVYYNYNYFYTLNTYIKGDGHRNMLKCSAYKPYVSDYFINASDLTIGNVYARGNNINLRDDRFASVTEWRNYIAEHDFQIVWGIQPVTYQLTPLQITALAGSNTVWADCGPVEFMYVMDVNIQKMIAEVSDSTASRAFAVGEYVIVNGKLYKVTADVSVDTELVPGTNIEETTVGEELSEIEEDAFDPYDYKEKTITSTLVTGLPIFELSGNTAGMTKDNAVTLNWSYKGDSGTATVKWQGASSVNYPKKNYSIKLDHNIDVGWGEQKKYVLKAEFVDNSHALNIGSAKLWGAIVADRNANPAIGNSPNNGAMTGFPVMVMLNGKFHGLFMFNTPKDKWTFGMGNNTSEYIVTAESHTSATQFKALAELDGTDFELEYKDDSVDEAVVKTSLNTMIQAVLDGGQNWEETVAPYLDIDSAIDYYIFSALTVNGDGIDKNFILTTYDGTKWWFNAYDMDSVMGNHWTGGYYVSPYNSQTNLNGLATTSRLFSLIHSYSKAKLVARYNYLRQNILSDGYVATTYYNHVVRIPEEIYRQDTIVWPMLPGTWTNNVARISDFYRMRSEYIDREVKAIEESLT